jgi:hypothetical protein
VQFGNFSNTVADPNPAVQGFAGCPTFAALFAAKVG